jgi:hypothetical protein
MESIRQQVLRHFPPPSSETEVDDQLAEALYHMLWKVDFLERDVDGWTFFHVVRESNDSIDAVGLMTLLSSGPVPMAIKVSAGKEGLAWSVKVARQDRDWLALSDSKQWNCVYLYATGARDEPQWTWDRTYQGLARRAE